VVVLCGVVWCGVVWDWEGQRLQVDVHQIRTDLLRLLTIAEHSKSTALPGTTASTTQSAAVATAAAAPAKNVLAKETWIHTQVFAATQFQPMIPGY
jgi:hypothetical protein